MGNTIFINILTRFLSFENYSDRPHSVEPGKRIRMSPSVILHRPEWPLLLPRSQDPRQIFSRLFAETVSDWKPASAPAPQKEKTRERLLFLPLPEARRYAHVPDVCFLAVHSRTLKIPLK